jgi:hypothetical protein
LEWGVIETERGRMQNEQNEDEKRAELEAA